MLERESLAYVTAEGMDHVVIIPMYRSKRV
jgi:hypothetical protein